jgi:hypothetical protein
VDELNVIHVMTEALGAAAGNIGRGGEHEVQSGCEYLAILLGARIKAVSAVMDEIRQNSREGRPWTAEAS